MKYTTDGTYEVKAGNKVIAKSYMGSGGRRYDVRILQGMDRVKTIEKICAECPQFALNNEIDTNYCPKLFSA